MKAIDALRALLGKETEKERCLSGDAPPAAGTPTPGSSAGSNTAAGT